MKTEEEFETFHFITEEEAVAISNSQNNDMEQFTKYGRDFNMTYEQIGQVLRQRGLI